MKFVITAKNNFDGINDHITDPLQRTEICTELIMTRLEAIRLLNEGVISKSDCIVTRIDRICLYENIFDKVIDYQEFREYIKNDHNTNYEVFPLTEGINHYDNTIPYKPFYQRFEQDKKQILDIELNPQTEEFPFICIVNRQTPNHPEKNISEAYWKEFISEFSDYTEEGIDVFVFGERLNIEGSVAHKYYENIRQVSGFKEWCTLLANKNCKCVISSCTGGVYPIFFTGHEDSKLLIIDNNELTKKHADSPSFYHECINFTAVRKEIMYHIPTAEELAKKVIEWSL